MISSLMEICKLSFLHKSSLKHLATAAERKPNEKFIKTVFSKSLLKTILEYSFRNEKIDAWHL
jgi:N utilization substance protein B